MRSPAGLPGSSRPSRRAVVGPAVVTWVATTIGLAILAAELPRRTAGSRADSATGPTGVLFGGIDGPFLLHGGDPPAPLHAREDAAA